MVHKEFRLSDLFTAHPVGILQICAVLPIHRVIPVQRSLKKHPPVDLLQVFQPIVGLGVTDHRVTVIEYEGQSGSGDFLSRGHKIDDLSLGFSVGDVTPMVAIEHWRAGREIKWHVIVE